VRDEGACPPGNAKTTAEEPKTVERRTMTFDETTMVNARTTAVVRSAS
jgi:hypothetical protein